ncbi:hypothetical protein Tco_1044486 [Tanacetum coccineum]|uniref:Uncharacterized protein n=1 Tax=Tanacetum coccineum TaxID=301880 RepID=A0ABQ5GQ21_9ASTR
MVNLLCNQKEKKVIPTTDEKKERSDWNVLDVVEPNHLIGDCPKPTRNKDQKAFIRGSWSDSKNDTEDKTNDETCLMAQSLNECNSCDEFKLENAKLKETRVKFVKFDKTVNSLREMLNNQKSPTCKIVSGYHQKPENHIQNATKLSMEVGKGTVQNQGKSPKKPKSESKLKESISQTGAGTEDTKWIANLKPI